MVWFLLEDLSLLSYRLIDVDLFWGWFPIGYLYNSNFNLYYSNCNLYNSNVNLYDSNFNLYNSIVICMLYLKLSMEH